MNPKVPLEDLESYCDIFFRAWWKYFNEEDYEACDRKIEEFITHLKPIYCNRLYGNEEGILDNYIFVYLFLMLAKAFEGIMCLVAMTKDKNWPQDEKKVESIWQALWDAKERLDVFDSHYAERETFAPIYRLLKKLELNFYDHFGKGVYFSPVIIVKRANCSICKRNIKACEHLPNNFYGGVRCKEIVEDMKFLGVDLVPSPHDMRCRVWPWNVTEDYKIQGRFMNLTQLDAWIEK